MLDDMTNPDLVAQIMRDENATEAELELAYRLQHAIDEINVLVGEVGVLEVRLSSQPEE